MNKNKIKEMAEEMIAIQCEESGCTREEVMEVSALCFLEKYIHDEISKEDLVALSRYLETPLDFVEVEKLKTKRIKQAEYRLNQKAKKLLERKRTKIGKGVRFKEDGLDKAVLNSLLEDYKNNKISKDLLLKTISLTGLEVQDIEDK